ncbi:Uncharacterised protein [Serratia plymuthica]|nr:Uncharacterised protein [Serratia plymuthica]
MKKSRFTDSQIMSILKQAEAGTPVAELCREHGMSNLAIDFTCKAVLPRVFHGKKKLKISHRKLLCFSSRQELKWVCLQQGDAVNAHK